MRADMSRVIVERPRRGGLDRRGRLVPIEDLPRYEGMRRPHRIAGDWKELNENLAPLRRYLERQVGRPWDKVYSEIAAHLRIGNTVQQHVRDHLGDFVAVKPRRLHGRYFTYPGDSRLWYQPLYVDENDGLLKRTDRLPEEKARRQARRNRPSPPLDRLALAADRALRRIDGFWYELRLVPMPDPVYRTVVERQKVPLKPVHKRSPVVEVEVTLRRLAGPSVRDAATGAAVEIGPEIDAPRAWSEYRRRHPDRHYAVAKRKLSKADLRRCGLRDQAPEDRPVTSATVSGRAETPLAGRFFNKRSTAGGAPRAGGR
jgi:hypothetical protein